MRDVCQVCRAKVDVESLPTGEARPCPACGQPLVCCRTAPPEAVRVALFPHVRAAEPVATRDEAIRLALQLLTGMGIVPESQQGEVFRRSVEREEIGSTAVGKGYAIPHTTNPAVKEVVGLVLELRDGVEWKSPDGVPVRTVIFLISPSRSVEHLHTLAAIAHTIRDKDRGK